ncbi:MAG: ABC transporter substrate-binding protein [Lachnospiraceae bacterium]|nr:ABC transporter substrate-binding protein [Lachnospiraceae bacterium]
MKKISRRDFLRGSAAAALSAAMAVSVSPVVTEAASGDTLNFGCYVYSTSFDPAAYQNAAWQGVRWGITECLFKFNDDMSVEPLLCDTYEVSDDKMTWTFHIRDGVLFSNGDVCDAQAVADSLNRLFYVCANSDDYSSTPAGYIDMASIEADTDANTVTIVTNTAVADLTATLCFPFYSIIDVYGDTTDADHAGGYATSVIATGPYALSSFDATTKSGSMVANENYWNGEVPYSTVNVTFIEDDSTKALSLMSGLIDLTENVTTSSDLATLEASDAYYVSKSSSLRSGFAYINFDGVLANDALRQAVRMAIDSETMCNITVGGMYTTGVGILPSSLIYEDENLDNPYAYDMDAAVALLDEAGIVDSDGDGIRELDGEPINLTYITYNNRCLSDFAQAIQVSLTSIGIGVSVNSTDSDTEWMLMQAGEYDLCDSNWTTVGTGDPTAFLLNWYGGTDGSNAYSSDNPDGTNYCNYDSDEFDALYEQFTASTDTDERNALVVEMEQVLVNDVAVLLHGYYNSTMISNASKVTGAEIATFDYYWLNTDIKPVG